MKRTPFSKWPCSVARTVDILGDWWTPLVLREAYYGVRRFDQFQEMLKIGRNVLTQRLGVALSAEDAGVIGRLGKLRGQIVHAGSIEQPSPEDLRHLENLVERLALAVAAGPPTLSQAAKQHPGRP